MAALVDSHPTLLVLVETRRGHYDGISVGTLALGGVAVAEARRATEPILQIEIEETRPTFLATFALDVLLAQAVARLRIAGWCIVERSAGIAAAWLTSLTAEFEVIRLATIALLAGDARFALTFSLAVTLQRA